MKKDGKNHEKNDTSSDVSNMNNDDKNVEQNDDLKESINRENKKPPPIVKGWKELVKPYKDTANFWYQLWRSNNKKREGVVYEQMKQTKNK